MLDAALHGIMLLEPVENETHQIIDFRVEATNRAIRKQIGFDIDHEKKPLLSAVFPNYREFGFFDCYTKALKTNQVQQAECYYRDERLDGWFDLGVAPQNGSLVVSFVNISESKKHQRDVERFAGQLQQIMDISQSSIFLFKPEYEGDRLVDFRFTMANRSLAAYVGQEPDTLIGDLGSKWFPSYKTNGLFELYRETFETGKMHRFDFHYDADDIDVWLDIQSTKFENHLLVTFTDFTPVKQLQLQLESSVNDLKKSNANLEEFAYVASHDLQEPLRKIHFFADRLKNDFKDALGKDGGSILTRMESATTRMRTLIEDLLLFSRVSSKRSEFGHVNLEPLVQLVLSDLETAIQEKSAKIDLGSLPVITGDKVQLRQLFQNLLSNALKYSRPAVTPQIFIRAKLVKGRDSGLNVSVTDLNKKFHLIEIADNGLGFEEENAERIFQIFQRLHGRSEYPGTGVGLAIVQKVVENHKGYVKARGVPDQGATFFILLPVQSEAN